MYSTLLMSCGMSPREVAELTLEQSIGVYMGLKGRDKVVSFQSVREMNQFIQGVQ